MSGWPLRSGLSLFTLACLILAVGCSEQLGNVSGEVKIKVKEAKTGKESILEVQAGVISFATQSRRKKAVSTNIEKGKYSITGVPVGKAKVMISGVTGELPTLDDKAKDAKTKPKGAKSKAPPSVFVNKKYNDPDRSGLECDVTAGDQEQNFVVEP